MTRPSGEELVYTYKANSYKINTVSDGSNSFTYNNYDSNGLAQEVISSDGLQTNWQRDGSLVTRDSLSNATGAQGYGEVRMTYSQQRLFSLDILGGQGNPLSSIAYSFDPDGFYQSMGDFFYNRNAVTGLVDSSSIDNISEVYTYDDYGDIKSYVVSQNGSTVYDYTMERDGLGRIETFSEGLNGVADVYSYNYDAGNRLRRIFKNNVQVSLSNYGPNSTRQSGTIMGSPFSATYDGHDRLLTWNNYTFAYNDNGEMTSKTDAITSGVTTYGWDAWGRLKSVLLPNADIVSYEYDGAGRKARVKLNNTTLYTLIYQSQYKPVAQFDGAGQLMAQFIWGEKLNTPEYMEKNGSRYRFITDPRGSVRLVVNTTSGAIVQRIDYDEWGKVLSDTNPGFQPFGYAGGLYDHQTELVEFGARHYEGMIGRWLSKDPILFEGGDPNLYGYVLNDPINYIDPIGLWRWPIDIYNDSAQEAADRFPNDPRSQNAFRHCLASCENTAENGSISTWFLGELNEMRGDLRGNNDRAIDEYNNEYGCYEGNRDRNRNSPNRQRSCQQSCQVALNAGNLK